MKLVEKEGMNWKHIFSRPNSRKPHSKIDRYYLAEGEYSTSG